GNTSPILLIRNPAPLVACFLANLNSFVFDFTSRKKVSGNHITLFILEQLPIIKSRDFLGTPPWTSNIAIQSWLLSRVLELCCTAWDLEPFERDCGFDGPPFRWDEERRFQIRCELDAVFFHLYLGLGEEWCRQSERLTKYFATPRDAAAYIMDTFPIV